MRLRTLWAIFWANPSVEVWTHGANGKLAVVLVGGTSGMAIAFFDDDETGRQDAVKTAGNIAEVTGLAYHDRRLVDVLHDL